MDKQKWVSRLQVLGTFVLRILSLPLAHFLYQQYADVQTSGCQSDYLGTLQIQVDLHDGMVHLQRNTCCQYVGHLQQEKCLYCVWQ